MERYYIFMGRKIQYFQDVSSSQLVYRFNAISVTIPASYFMDIDKLILKFIQRGKRPRIVNTILKEKNKFEGLTLTNLKTYYTALIKTCGIGERRGK